MESGYTFSSTLVSWAIHSGLPVHHPIPRPFRNSCQSSGIVFPSCRTWKSAQPFTSAENKTLLGSVWQYYYGVNYCSESLIPRGTRAVVRYLHVRLEPVRPSSSSVMRLWPVVGHTVAGGRTLTSLSCYKLRTGCHFGDHALLRGESAIQRVGKDDRENRGQKIGVHEQSAVRIKAGDFY